MNNSIVFEGILISQAYEVEGDILKQTFSFNKRDRLAKYIKDSRFILYDKFEETMREFSLGGVLYFVKRIDFDDRVEIYYELKEDFSLSDLKPTNFKLVDYVPPNPGCAYCLFKGETKDDLFFFCDAKQKSLSKEIKTCKYFKQKRLYKS